MTRGAKGHPKALRKAAEAHLAEAAPASAPEAASPVLDPLVHELRVHQIELELQNEELREAKAESDRMRERYFDFYEASPTGFLTLDAHGHILQVNLKAAHQLGCQPRALVGLSFASFLGRPDQRAFQEALDRLFQGSPVQNLEVTLQVRGLASRKILLEAMMPPGARECRAVLVDVTELRRVQDQRRLLEERLLQAQKLESLGRLAAGVAHDMNNILTAIMSTATVSLRTLPEAGPGADMILEACRQGRDLVQGLLDFSRREIREPVRLDLNDLVTRSGAILARTTLNRVAVRNHLDPALPPLVGSPHGLANALMNLYLNAADAMPTGGTLTVTTQRAGAEEVLLKVEDTGAGMTQEVLDHVMEPFFTTKEVGEGTGLGLPVVYGTVRAHGGRIEIRSAPGRGTCVEIHLPVPRTAPAAKAPLPPVPGAAARRGHRILLVEDKPLERQASRLLLESLGHQVTEAGGGQEALRLLKEKVPVDRVLLDLNMPGMGGLETLRRLRKVAPLLPVVVASGFIPEDVGVALRAIPATRVLGKPHTPEDLEAALA